jgi:hypothetical protein
VREIPEVLKNVCVVIDKFCVLLRDFSSLRIVLSTLIINGVCFSQSHKIYDFCNLEGFIPVR